MSIRELRVAGEPPEALTLTENERFWIEALRMASGYSDPRPTLQTVQQLRSIFGEIKLDTPPAAGGLR